MSKERTSVSSLYKALRNKDHDEVATRLVDLRGTPPKLLVSGNSKSVTPLHLAAQHGWCDIVISLIEQYGFTSTLRDNAGRTPLHYACEHDQLDTAKVLVSEYNCDQEGKDKDGMTPLHLACENNCASIVQYLTSERHCSPNVVDNIGDTPLHKQCRSACPNSVCISLLLKTPHCNPNIKNKNGLTPLQVTPLHHEVVIQTLILNGVDPNVVDKEGNTPLHRACAKGRESTAKCLLLSEMCNPNTKNMTGLTPLHLVPYKCSSMIKTLVQHGANANTVDNDGNTPLHAACRRKCQDSVQYLLEYGYANPNIENSDQLTPLQVTAPECSSIIQTLMENGADPNVVDSDGNTPLHKACANGAWIAEYLLLSKRCNPNAKNKSGLSPLQVTPPEHTNIIKALIQRGANPNVVDSNGNTLLHKVCAKGSQSTVLYLLQSKLCNPNVKNREGLTPVQVAPLECANTIETLILYGADPNVVDTDGNTPLHKSCAKGTQCVEHLLLSKKCDINLTNKAGLTPLQVTPPEYSSTISTLIQHGADPNVVDIDGNTPLHKACRKGKKSVEYILRSKICNPNAKNKAGLTALQVTPSKHVSTIKILIKHQVDPNVTDEDGNTPLHKACSIGATSVDYLLQSKKCNPNVKNKAGLTPLQVTPQKYSSTIKALIRHGADLNVTDPDGNTPLHNACSLGTRNVGHLLQSKCCQLNAKNKDGLTPLQVTPPEHKSTVTALIEHGADVNVVDSDGNTPLHKACAKGEQSVLNILQSSTCKRNLKNNAALTPLHITPSEYLTTIETLIQHGADPNVVDSDGNTPLHKACAKGARSVECFLQSKKSDLKAVNNAGFTPLQVTSLHHTSTIQSLIEHGADTNVVDKDGNTQLHKACMIGYGCLDTVRCLLQAVNTDPNSQNNFGLTPLQVTPTGCTSIIRELIKHGATTDGVYKIHNKLSKQPLQSLVKVLVVGDPSVGKSTLTLALQKETSILWRTITPAKKVIDVDTKTAGVVPHNFKSREYGYTTIYDFAGQRDFYGSHAALMQNVIQSTPPIILLLVNLCESEEFIKQNILYWLSFLENQCRSVNGKPHVIIVGSHTDLLTSRGEDPNKKAECLKPDKSIHLKHFVFVGFINIDCQYSESAGMTALRQCLKTSCNALREQKVVSLNSHCFYVYLLDMFKESTAITINQVKLQIQRNQHSDLSDDMMGFIPSTLHTLVKICSDLNDRGHLMFLKNESNPDDSWIVIDRPALLTVVTGTIFAPKDFKQHRVVTQCTCSTGVVPLRKIAFEFPQYDAKMIIGFLSCLEYCHEISDKEILDLITENHQKCVVNESSHRSKEPERYFLFPALVSLNVPSKVWQSKPGFPYQCGWILQCSNDVAEQFFPSRFLQVLLLRLAFSFALIQETDTFRNNPALKRKGSIWKNGIFWARQGVETLVEVLPINRAVVLLMRCIKQKLVNLLCLRSQVIHKVLTTASEICHHIDTVESFIDPREITQYPLKPTSELMLFSFAEMSRAVFNENVPLVVDGLSGSIPLNTLLSFEPYAELGQSVVCEIFANQQSTQKVPNALLLKISKQVSENAETFIEIFKPENGLHCPDTPTLYETLQVWRNECEGTYKGLRQILDKHSIFTGRNPLKEADILDIPPNSTSDKNWNTSHNNEEDCDPTPLLKSEKPTLCQLQLLKGPRGKNVKVIESVAAEWEQLAIALGLGAAAIDYMTRDFNRDAVGASTQVLVKWLNGDCDSDKPITWDTLIGCLSDAGFVGVVEDLEEVFQDIPPG